LQSSSCSCCVVIHLVCSSDDDIDQLLKELDIAPGAAAAAGSGSSGRPGSSGTGAAGSQPALLGIDPKKIRGDEELRRIFGAGVIEAVDRMEGELLLYQGQEHKL
jgi:hypothetical protein